MQCDKPEKKETGRKRARKIGRVKGREREREREYQLTFPSLMAFLTKKLYTFNLGKKLS